MADVCMPNGTADASLSIDPEIRFQTLIGFGAGVGYTEEVFVDHRANAELREALFVDAGLDALRLRNRYEEGSEAGLLVTARLLSEVEETLGRRATVLINASSPPGVLKANGQLRCAGDADACMLRRDTDGNFDYLGLAEYWRASVAAYADAGVPLDFVSLQNQPNRVPSAESPGDACWFLPEEGTSTVSTNGMDVTVPVAGYREALAAVRNALATVPSTPAVVAPETRLGSSLDYTSVLSSGEYDALSVHLHDVDPAGVDVEAFEALGRLSIDAERPVLQTQTHAEGLESAVLMHHALVHANASSYLQHELVTTVTELAPFALLYLSEDSFERQLPWYTFAHYARYTDPGWVRVEARVEGTPLLVSAFQRPDGEAMALVLLNPSDQAVRTHLTPPSGSRGARVERTVYDGIERVAHLGPLPSDGSLRLPPRSILTVVLEGQ